MEMFANEWLLHGILLTDPVYKHTKDGRTKKTIVIHEHNKGKLGCAIYIATILTFLNELSIGVE